MSSRSHPLIVVATVVTASLTATQSRSAARQPVYSSWQVATPPRAPDDTFFPAESAGAEARRIAKQQSVERLLAKTDESIRVIVGTDIPFQPEGRLNTTAATSQRDSIRAGHDAILAQIPANQVWDVKRFDFIPYFAAEASRAGLVRLAALNGVSSVEEDVAHKAVLRDSSPLIGATTAWGAGVAGAGWSVAVLDSGVDRNHPFLAGKVVSEACYSTTSVSYGTTSLCPGGASNSVSSGSASPCPVSGCDHGTHVAGIATGRGTAFSGVARDASVLAIQVFSNYLGSKILSYTSDEIMGLQRVFSLRTSFNIASVNMSLGGSAFTSTCDSVLPATKAAIDSLRSVGIPTVIAAGNDGYVNAIGGPACISTAVSVGSTTKTDTISSFSDRASFLSVMAPGSAITSSVPGGGFAAFSGTSMATPQVAGAWAIFRQLKPTASVSEVLAAIRATGRPIPDEYTGTRYPRIQIVPAALTLIGGGGVQSPGAPANFTASASGSTVTLTWSAPTTGGSPTAYIIEAGSAPGLANLANFSTGNTATTFSASGVGAGSYYVRVRATNAAGTSSPSNESLLVVGGGCTAAPPAPTGFANTFKSNGTVTFVWNASANATTYIIEAGSTPGATNLANANLGSSATTATFNGVGNGVYYVRLRAQNACGTSGVSNEVTLILP